LYTKEDSNSQKDRQQTFLKEKKLEAFDSLKKYFFSLLLLNFKDKYGKTLLYEIVLFLIITGPIVAFEIIDRVHSPLLPGG
jgi:hypothetical protein